MNKTFSQKLSSYAPVVLRLAMAAVFVWFGVSQLANPNAWISLVPAWATNLLGASALTVVYLNGILEIILGSFLAVGFYARIVAAVLFIHLLVIVSHLGLNAIGVRDFGLSFATLAIALFEEDKHCLKFKDELSQGGGVWHN